MEEGMSPTFIKNNLDKTLAEYFDGYERYGYEEDKGHIEELAPNEYLVLKMHNDKESIYIGPAEDVRGFYKLEENISKTDLENHKNGNGWKAGRFVLETSPEKYHVWIRTATEKESNSNKWIKLSGNERVVHYDKGVEEGKSKEVDIEKPSRGMGKILEKMERYFGDYEFGVHRGEIEEGKKEGAVWKVKADSKAIDYLKAMNAQGKHIYIRPSFEKEPYFMMHDDIDSAGLEKIHKINGRWKAGRMVVETSPGNYQVWIKSDRPLELEEKKHWLKEMGSDPGANPLHRWGRSPGYRNRKEKYHNEKGYPLSRIAWVDWKNQAKIPLPEINHEKTHRLSKPLPSNPSKRPNNRPNNETMPTRDQYYKGVDDKGKVRESEQDYAYSMALLRRGVPKEEVKQRIKTERTDWTNHQGEKRKEHYLQTTVDNAEKKVIETQTYNRERSQTTRSKERTANYKITVNDIKTNKKKDFEFNNVPIKGAKNKLNSYAKRAIVSMGYEKADGLEISIHHVRQFKKEVALKQETQSKQF